MAQASQKVKPILEQAAAAAVAVADASGTAKAHAAAKKAKKLTPEEMKLMRQQADPNFSSKKDAPAHAQAASKKSKQQKEVPAAAVNDVAAGPTEHTPATAQAASGDVGIVSGQQAAAPFTASKSATAGASAATGSDNTTQQQPQGKAAPGNKRHHGLGFTEEQPSAKRSKQQDGQANATSRTEESQQASVKAQPAQHDAKAQGLDAHGATHAKPQSTHAGGSRGQGQGIRQPGQGSSQSGQGGQQAGQNQAAAGASGQAPVVFTDECTAFIRGLDSKVTESELKGLLSPCGDIKDIRIVVDKATSRPKVPFCTVTCRCDVHEGCLPSLSRLCACPKLSCR